MKTEDLKGRILFFAQGDTFYEFVSVFEKEPEFDNQRLKLIELDTGKEHVAHFLEEIGEELILLPLNYPQARINSYLKAAKEFEAARDIMLDIQQEILLHPETTGM